MKSVLLYLVTPLVTFAIGVGTDRLIGQRPAPAVTEPGCTGQVDVIPQPPTQVIPVAAPAPPLAPKPILVMDYSKGSFGIDARYVIMGPKPREFADFEGLYLSLSSDPRSEYSHTYISISEYTGKVWEHYSASFALVTQKRLFFVTSKGFESDFEYRFEGEFVRTDFSKIADKNIVALRGKLTKTKDGRKLAEHPINLRMEYLGC